MGAHRERLLDLESRESNERMYAQSLGLTQIGPPLRLQGREPLPIEYRRNAPQAAPSVRIRRREIPDHG